MLAETDSKDSKSKMVLKSLPQTFIFFLNSAMIKITVTEKILVPLAVTEELFLCGFTS